MENSKYYLDAIHLAGYVTECSLKALILRRAPESKWADICEEIGSGAKAHNLDFLEGILRRRRCSIPVEVVESLNSIKREWTTDLRYEGALISYGEAEKFIKDTIEIHEWVERSM